MRSSGSLHAKTAVLISFMVIFGPLGNVLLGKGMKQIGVVTFENFPELVAVLSRVLSSGMIWLGIASLMIFFVANILVLSWADYSYVLPASAAAYGIVALLGHFVLHEPVTPLHWTGVAIICMGVLVVGQTPPRTTEPR